MVAEDARTAVTFSLSPGQAHDAPAGRALLSRLGAPERPLHGVIVLSMEFDTVGARNSMHDNHLRVLTSARNLSDVGL